MASKRGISASKAAVESKSTHPPHPLTAQDQTLLARLRKIVAAWPETHDKLSHGTPTWWGGKKTFAMYHTGGYDDGRRAIWIKAAPGAQESLIEHDPERFYRPKYVGPAGWVGVRLDRGVDWAQVQALLFDGYVSVAPRKVLDTLAGSRAAANSSAAASRAKPKAQGKKPSEKRAQPEPARPVQAKVSKRGAVVVDAGFQGMSAGAARRFAARWLPAWTGNRPELLASFYANDAFYSDPAIPEGVSGHAKLLEYFRRLLAHNPDWVWTHTGSVPLADGFLNHWHASVPVGKSIVEIDGVCVVQLRDGLIYSNRVFFDRSPLLAAIAASRPRS